MPRTDSKGRTRLTPGEAIKAGWRWWIVLMVLAGLALAALLATQPMSGGGRAEGLSNGLATAGAALIGVAIAWLVLLGAVVLLLRSYCFRAQWDGRAVEPGSYLKGMYQVWGVLAVGALLAVLGAMLMGSVMPGVLVSLAAVLALIFSRPDGRAIGA
jgi:hypothetical protein